MPVKNRIQLRRGTSSEWAGSVDILADGEMGYDTTLQNLKAGNGVDYWPDLPWLPVIGVSGQIINPSIVIANTGDFDVISFNTDIETDLLKGQLSWNDTEGTVNIGLTDTADIHIGEHSFFRVRNETGDILYKGQVVYASGVHANGIILPDLYAADGTIREVRFMGFMLENLNNNNNGYAIQFGHIKELDTRGNVASNIAVGDETWADGDILYVHPTVPGKLTKVEPKHSIIAAIILDAANNGSIFVRPTSYGHLSDNHDVNVSGATNGQFLQYNSSTDYWVPSSSGNFTNLTINNNQIVTGQGSSNHIAYWNSSSGISYDNGQLYWDSSSNELGIGTNNPARNIDVVSSAGTSVGIKLNSTGTGGRSYSFFSTNNGSSLGGGKFGMYDDTTQAARLVIDGNGNIGVGTNSPTYKLEVDGPFSATTKSFKIKHPSKEGGILEYGSLESPYHGIRLTGKDKLKKGICVIKLPDYVKDLVQEEGINFQITNYKHHKILYVDKIDLNKNQITIKGYRCKSLGELEFFWTFSAIRKDVPELIVEK